MDSRILFLSVILTVMPVLSTWGQDYQLSSRDKKAVRNYTRAEMAYRERNNPVAVLYLNKAVQADSEFIEAWLLLGDAYTELDQPSEAIRAYEKALQVSPDFFPRANYFIGQLKFQSGLYEEAIEHFLDYRSGTTPGSPSFHEVEEAIDNARFAEYCVRNPTNSHIEHAGKRLNSPDDDYVNFVSADGRRMILTRKVVFDAGFDGMPFIERLYESKMMEDTWDHPDTIPIRWDEGLSIGGVNVSVDGRKMYFTGCNFPDGYGSCDLYFSFRQGMEWYPPMNLGTTINSQWWDSQPIISPNGKMLFYASRRAGGRGGSDIWMSVRLNSGKWSPPINLGDSINTAGNEMAPFLHADGKTLYFTSDRHPGLGGSDLFVSRRDDAGRWSKAVNLGYPINTHEDEINIIVSLEGSKAWLSSNRSGGAGGADIYRVDLDSVIASDKVVFVTGQVRDAVSRKPLQAMVELTDLITGNVVDTTTSDKITGEFLMVLQPGNDYAFNITRKGYVFYSEHMSPKDTPGLQSVKKDFLLSPLARGVTFVLENVFFDFDKAELKAVSYPELDRLFNILQEYGTLKIRIAGHTDNVGEKEYNLRLSTQRAKAVFEYLASRGIAAERMDYAGFGDTIPLESNDTAEGRARNRRTEITFVE